METEEVMRYLVSAALLSTLVFTSALNASGLAVVSSDTPSYLQAGTSELDVPVWEPPNLPSMFPALVGGPLLAQESGSLSTDAEAPGKPEKSPGRALLFSTILPGAGEFYAGARKRAAVFFGLEVAAWALWSSWNSEGNDIEDEFRELADSDGGWDALAYLAWDSSSISSRSSKTHHLPCRSFIEETENFDACPETEKQQYYELIGKYNQFVAGWTDVIDQQGNSVEFSEIDSVENYHSDLRIAYEDRRNDSNKLLKRATNVAGLILVNHVLSAIDAARAARSTVPSPGAGAHPAERTRLAFVLPAGGLDGTPMLMAYRRF